MFEYISPKYNITLEEWNHDKDHVHLLFRGSPNSDILNSLMLIKALVAGL